MDDEDGHTCLRLRVGDSLGSVSATRLRENPVHMGLDGGLAHEKVPPDLGI